MYKYLQLRQMPLVLSPLNTERLYLFPATSKLYILELHDRPAFASTLNAHVPEEWPPDQVTPEVIEDFIGRIQARERKIWSFYWILRQKGPEQPVLIGSGGFLAHKNGTLEIGYSLLDAYQGRGYATEAVQSMMQWVSSSLKRYNIVAYTYPHLKASIQVLEKNGFLFKGKGPEEGTIAYEFLNGNKNFIPGSREIQVEEIFTENNLSTSINVSLYNNHLS
jgi:[ribosomal protein S5]-alanine N-acetyltransferase